MYMLPVSSVVPLGTAMLSPAAIFVKNCGTGSGGFKRGNRCAGGGKPGTEAGNKAMLASMSDEEAIRWRGVLDAARRVRSAVIKNNGCTDGYCESAAASLAKELIMNHDEEPKVASGYFRSDGSVPDFDDPEGYHHWVEVGGKVVDPTADQFDKSISDVLIVDVGDKRYTRSGFSTHLTDPWIKKRDQLREEEKSLGGVAWSKNCGIGSGGFQQGNTCARGGSGGGAAGGHTAMKLEDFKAVVEPTSLKDKGKWRVTNTDGSVFVGKAWSRAMDGSHIMLSGKLEKEKGKGSLVNYGDKNMPAAIEFVPAGAKKAKSKPAVDPNSASKPAVAAKPAPEPKPVAQQKLAKPPVVSGKPFLPPKEHVDYISGKQDAHLEAMAKKRGVDKQALIDEWDGAVKASVAKAGVFVAAPPDVVDKVLREGRYKSQFETKSSYGGDVQIEERRGAEAGVLGVPVVTKDKDRPVYGYASDRPPSNVGKESVSKDIETASNHIATRGYGSVILEMKDSVKDRSTITFGDSLNHSASQLSSPMRAPSYRSLDFVDGSEIVPNVVKHKSVDAQAIYEQGEWRSGDYTEVQIHHGLPVTDVAKAWFRKEPSVETQGLLKARGIPWQLM